MHAATEPDGRRSHRTLAGVLPIVHVPFDARDRIDRDDLAREIDWIFSVGADGLGTGMVSEVVRLTAGEQSSLAFSVKPAVVPTATTSLTLRVPADAKVFLAGNATASSGAVRQFETSSLRAGQTWKNYEIRVVAVVDGTEQTVSKVIDLKAGDTVDLALDPTTQVASAGSTAKL